MFKYIQNLKIVVWKEGKYFVAQCLNVDVSSFGKSQKEAVSNVKEALELYFEDTKKPVIPKIERPQILSFNSRV
ncbi:MAG: type II toxin-antitoxin system HicB family antitoxin [Parcubacteria group bacterium]|nr:type II toxin-antitoxin system HicB family antitoxin [Parcubacteria group bacterium]